MDTVDECASYLLYDLYRTFLTLTVILRLPNLEQGEPLPYHLEAFVLFILTFEAWSAPPPGELRFSYFFTSFIARRWIIFIK